MHRLILSSATYQQAVSGGQSAPLLADNFSPFARRRLDAEELRDTLLALTGELERTLGTGHPFPSENTWAFTQHNPFKAVYDSPKPSIYLMTQRIQRHPFLSLFDGADTSASTAARSASTVPTQALWFLHDPFVHARAGPLAARLLTQPDDTHRLTLAYRLCLQRAPTDAEAQSARAFLAAYRNEGATAAAAWTAWARILLSSNELLHLD